MYLYLAVPILQYGADPNIKNNYGATAPMNVSKNGHKDNVELLSIHNVDS